jgi:hypothetical protein
VIEKRFLEHECKQMKREAELKSPSGQTAWHYYQLWMRAQNRMPPPAATFLTSKYFRTFIEFVKFSKSVDLPVPERFIKVMVMKGFSPTMWRNDEVYSIYIEWLDRKMSPLDQAKLSITTLMSYSEKHEIPIDEVFDRMPVQDAIHLIRVRKLSPWLLMFSRTFRVLFTIRTTPEQKIIMENLIRPSYWADKRDDHADAVAIIKTLVAEMGI